MKSRSKKYLLHVTLLITLCLAVSCPSGGGCKKYFSITPQELASLRRSYYSDYFSFIGSDDRGRVAFALDNNRGQDGNAWQAEHFVVLHDEKSGWLPVQGSGPYENASRKLAAIPDSPFFSFSGDVNTGLSIVSTRNRLSLSIEPMNVHIARREGLAQYRLGSADATLAWGERKLKGRVIHEYLFVPGFNRLTRSYPGAFHDFHGLYFSAEGKGDLYLHRQSGSYFSPLIRPTEGFLFLGGEAYPLESIDVKVRHRSFAPGFYRWPFAWTGGFRAGSDVYEFSAETLERKTISTWLVGGFSMATAQGELISANGTWALYGLAELIM